MKRQVYIFGWNGQQNAGDDAMASAIIEYMSDYFSDEVDFHLSSHSGKLAKYTDRNVSIKPFTVYGPLAKIPLIRRYVARWRIRRIFGGRIDYLIFGGGSTIQTEGNSRIKRKIVKTAREYNENLVSVAIGVSVGPFTTNESGKAAMQFLGDLDMISVRDKRSYDFLSGSSLKPKSMMHPDLAMSLPLQRNYTRSVKPAADEPRDFRIGVCLRHGRSEEFYPVIRKLIESLAQNREVTLDFIALSGNKEESDFEEAEQYLREVKNNSQGGVRHHHTQYQDDPIFYYQKLAECDAVICVRLHAAVFAYCVGAPMVICSYHEKCTDFASLIELDTNLVLNAEAGDSDIDACVKELTSWEMDDSGQRDQIMRRSLGHFEFLNSDNLTLRN